MSLSSSAYNTKQNNYKSWMLTVKGFFFVCLFPFPLTTTMTTLILGVDSKIEKCVCERQRGKQASKRQNEKREKDGAGKRDTECGDGVTE